MKLVESALVAHFKAPIYVDHLLLAASRSVYKEGEEGITCILNTSALTCVYDGEHITKYLLNGGYVFGDEGSSNELSKLFISDIIKGFAPKELSDLYKLNFNSDFNNLMKTFYSGIAIQSFDSTVYFLIEHAGNPYVINLIKKNFQNFIKRNLSKLEGVEYHKIKIVGKFAYHFKDLLQETFEENNIKIDAIVESAMEGLIDYHIKHPIY